MIQLSGKQIRHLRGLAHHLPVVIMVGNSGLTDTVKLEFDRALSAHELVKVKLPAAQSSDKRGFLQELCQTAGAAPVQLIGRVGVAYRPAEQPRITLP